MGRHAQLICQLVLLITNAPLAATSAAADKHVFSLTVGNGTPGDYTPNYVSGSCTPNSWVDYQFNVTKEMADTNLMFEVEDLGDSYNPEALMIAIWEYAVPSDRAAEHRTERAAGKVWAVGMNNECFVVGTVTLGVRCSAAASVSFRVKVVVVQASIEPSTAGTTDKSLKGEVCPGEWVYHYVDTAKIGAGHFGAGHHLRFTLSKDANEGAAIAMTRHLSAPLKTVPPYVSFEYSTVAASAPIELCNVESGLQYLGVRGAESDGGCMHYTLNAEEFTSDCVELMHAPSNDSAAIADKTLPVEHFERASCGPHQWYDFYFPVTPHMVDVEDNIVFEVEIIADQYELGGISVHLYQGTIPLNRGTELVSDTPDNGIYSIAIPSIELQAGAYYLSVKCGPNAQRFRVVAFEVRGILTGPGDAVHGEICPNEWLYHSVKPTFIYDPNATVVAASGHRRLGRSHRRLAGSGGVQAIAAGTHLQATFNKHEGDFIFMSLNGDHPPTRIQPPSRTLHDYDQIDYAIFCNVMPGNTYWLALYGGHHCATYDLAVTQLEANDTRCATGEFSLVPNEVAATGLTELVKERPAYGSVLPGQYVDYFVPLTYAADSDENLRFQVELMGNSAGRPDALALLIYTGGEIPSHRQTEIFADRSVDGVWSVTINVAELKYQLCKATNFAGPTCAKHGGGAHGGDGSASSNASAMVANTSADSNASSVHRRQLSAAPSVAGGADLTYYVSVRASDSAPAQFKMIATAIKSHLVNSVSVHGEICPGAFIYHHWEHAHVGEKRSVRFRITKHGGDGYFLVRHGTTLDSAPLKLAPPYLHMHAPDEHAHIEYCNASDSVGDSAAGVEGDHVYVMLVGGEHCMSYEIMAEEEPNDQCQGMGFGSVDPPQSLTEVSPHHFLYASCANNDWVDFYMTLTADDYHYNYLIEVEDLSDTHDPTALALYLYDYSIPYDRRSEQRAEVSIDGIYSLAINRHNFHKGTSYISVNCRDVGPTPRRFRLVLYQIEEFLSLDKEYHGEVSPGQWVYHSYTVPTDGMPHNFTFHVVKHTGDFEVVVRHGVVPLKLIPPYTVVGMAAHDADTQVCGSLPGEKVYLGMLGGGHAASYEIVASELPPGAPCQEADHTAGALGHSNHDMHELKASPDPVLTLGHCEAEGWYDAWVNVTEENLYNNLIFELEDLGHTGALDAVAVYMWAGAIPTSRKSEFFTKRAYDDVYSLSVSMHEMEPFLEHGDGSMVMYFGVKCGPRPVRFRAFATFVHSHLDTGHTAHGEVCPGEWVYHKLDIDDSLIYGTVSGTGDAHRRLAAIGVDVDGGVTTARREAMEGRGLSAEVEDTPGVHVKMHIVKNVGVMNLMVSLNDKPLRLIPTDTTYMEAGDSTVDLILCNVDRYYRNVSSYAEGKMKFYLGINGGDTCAHYEIATTTFTSSCAEAQAERIKPAEHVDALHGSAGARECRHGDADCVLSMRHFMRGSCAPQERAPPFVVKIPYKEGEPLDNLVLEVEDLNVEENPNSLSIALYKGPEADGACAGKSGSCTHEQLQMVKPLRTTSAARARIFSFGISSIEMQEAVCGGKCTSSGTFALNMVVRCASSTVRFQAISILTQLILKPDVPVHGEVCPGNWIYHRTSIPDNALYHDSAGVRFNLHVHQGDVYYMITRWDHSPGFAACNENEVGMSFKVNGQADLCHLTEKFESTFSEDDKTVAAANGTDLFLTGYIGLYGGTSCAHYTIETQRLVNTTCDTKTTGTCASAN